MAEKKEKKKFNMKESMSKLKRFWKGPLTPNYYLSLKEVTGFGVASLGINFILNIGYIILTTTIIPIAYNVEAIHATIITVVVSLLSLIVTPIFGRIIDGKKTKKGNKIKPHFLWITPAITIFAILASFSPVDIITNKSVRLVYLYCTAVPSLLLQSLFLSLFNLYPAVMTPNSQERANMLSPVSLVYSFAPTIMNILFGPMRDFFKQRNMEHWAFRLFGIIFGLLGLALTFFIFKFTKERTYDTETSAETGEKKQIKFSEGFKMIFKNKPLILYMLFTIFTVLKTTFFLQAQLVGEYKYQADYGTSIYSLLTAVTGFGATPGMLLAPILIKKVGKKNLILIGTGIQTVILVILACIGFQHIKAGAFAITICTAYGFLYNICTGLNIIVFPSIMADLIDYQQYISDARIEGFINSANLWISALFGVVFQFIPVLVQTKVIGFEPGLGVFRPSPESIANGLFNPDYVVSIADSWFNASVYIALAACVLSMIPLFFYTFNEKKHKQCMEEIKLRAVGSSFEDEESLSEAKEEALQELEEEGVKVDASEIVEVTDTKADDVKEETKIDDTKVEDPIDDVKEETKIDDIKVEDQVDEVKEDEVPAEDTKVEDPIDDVKEETKIDDTKVEDQVEEVKEDEVPAEDTKVEDPIDDVKEETKTDDIKVEDPIDEDDKKKGE